MLDPTCRSEAIVISTGRTPPPFPQRLNDVRIGIRHDEHWLSWDWVLAEWVPQLADSGAPLHYWRVGSRLGKEAARVAEEQAAFYEASDLTIVGLANCGGCTMQSVADALGSLEAGVPTVLVSTEHFVDLAHTLAAEGGWPALPIVSLPFPLEGLPEGEVRQVGRSSFDQLANVLGFGFSR